MNAVQLHLTAPRRAVEPALLAQRLPRIAAALRLCRVKHCTVVTPAATAPSAVQVFAAQLSVQRNHVTLEALPALDAGTRAQLQQWCSLWCADCDADLVFTPHSGAQSAALGEVNLTLALASTAQFIGRDIATALPKTPQAKALRQLFNASQMALHAQPLPHSRVNSLWFSQGAAQAPLAASAYASPQEGLAWAYLQGGLSAWWDALPAWDVAQATLLLERVANRKTFMLHLTGADYVLSLECEPQRRWAFWRKAGDLTHVIQRLSDAQ